MKELKKINDNYFNEIYKGVAVSGASVTCILDDNCVRYMVLDANGKCKSRREYSNNQKDLCFQRATEKLNKI